MPRFFIETKKYRFSENLIVFRTISNLKHNSRFSTIFLTSNFDFF